ncbi:MAG TPA: hypothetical protein VEH77_19310, partial [Roseiarcus sp.]|nr:hypothetical protein [Roseiarcus sp.]
GRGAQIPGLVISGKTGTTNGSTNVWFNAFTGNLVGSVWFGNDENTPMENLVGGLLPAQTWREIMVFAHRGLEPKPPFGVAPPPSAAPPVAQAQVKSEPEDASAATPPIGLSPAATQALIEIRDLARSAGAGPQASTERRTAPDERDALQSAAGSP